MVVSPALERLPSLDREEDLVRGGDERGSGMLIGSTITVLESRLFGEDGWEEDIGQVKSERRQNLMTAIRQVARNGFCFLKSS